MVYNPFRLIIAFRITLLTITVFAAAYFFYANHSWMGSLLFLVLTVVQVYSMYNFIAKTNNEIIDFIDSLKADDFSTMVQETTDSPPLLRKEFNKILKKIKEIETEKEANYQYLKNIVQHLGIGIITFDRKGGVQIMNTAAKRLLKTTQIRNISALGKISPLLVQSFEQLKTGGRDLVRVEIDGDIKQLAIYAIELTLNDQEFKLVSLQNIQSELEEKEMEAWQNLIRVLTHEIMNSVTPISSLAATVDAELVAQLKNELEINPISNEDIQDLHMAVSTIQKRSEGLIRFVTDFRNLTRIPTPKITDTSVKDLFDRIVTLFKNDISKNNISLSRDISPADLNLKVDQELIEQVLINLVKNAIQAMEETEDRKLSLTAYSDRKNQFIKITDNGSGIDEEALEKLFIPFFTTKKNGSGIGLSLSRQIMRQHKASISVHSIIDEGTEFTLKF